MPAVLLDIAVFIDLQTELLGEFDCRGVANGNKDTVGLELGCFVGFVVDQQNLVYAFFAPDLFDFGVPEYGDIVFNGARTKSAKILESEANVVTIQQVTGGTWNTADTWTNTLSHQSADASNLLTKNKTFLAHQAYYKFTADQGSTPTGAAGDVT